MTEPTTAAGRPRTKGNPAKANTPTGIFLVRQGVPEWQVADVEAEALGDRPRTGVAEARQQDGSARTGSSIYYETMCVNCDHSRSTHFDGLDCGWNECPKHCSEFIWPEKSALAALPPSAPNDGSYMPTPLDDERADWMDE